MLRVGRVWAALFLPCFSFLFYALSCDPFYFLQQQQQHNVCLPGCMLRSPVTPAAAAHRLLLEQRELRMKSLLGFLWRFFCSFSLGLVSLGGDRAAKGSKIDGLCLSGSIGLLYQRPLPVRVKHKAFRWADNQGEGMEPAAAPDGPRCTELGSLFSFVC